MAHFISHIATVEIPVTDLQKSINFYTEMVGLTVESSGDHHAMLSFNLKSAPTLFLVETEDNQRLSFKNTSNNVEHSVIDFYTADLRSFYTWLQEQNVAVTTLNVHGENELGGFGFKDPDGNMLGASNILHRGQ